MTTGMSKLGAVAAYMGLAMASLDEPGCHRSHCTRRPYVKSGPSKTTKDKRRAQKQARRKNR